MAKNHDTRISKRKESRRALAPWDDDMWRGMERMMERFAFPSWPRWPRDWFPAEFDEMLHARVPRVDVIDGDKAVTVRAELPGVDRKDLDVSVTEDSVQIRGSTRSEEKEEKESYYRSEIRRGEFSRTVALPASVDADKAKATFRDGILEIVLPKTEARKRHTVSVD